jgi:hypothetical protein
LRKGFRVLGKAHDFVMGKWPQRNENDAPKSGKKSKGSPQNIGFNGKVAPKVIIFWYIGWCFAWFWGDATCCWRYFWMGINEFGIAFPWIWCDFFMLREVSRDSLRTLWELCGNSAGTLWDLSGNSPETPKAKSPWFAQGFQDFWQGAWARSVMEKWSRSNENDAPKSGKASKKVIPRRGIQ